MTACIRPREKLLELRMVLFFLKLKKMEEMEKGRDIGEDGQLDHATRANEITKTHS